MLLICSVMRKFPGGDILQAQSTSGGYDEGYPGEVKEPLVEVRREPQVGKGRGRGVGGVRGGGSVEGRFGC